MRMTLAARFSSATRFMNSVSFSVLMSLMVLIITSSVNSTKHIYLIFLLVEIALWYGVEYKSHFWLNSIHTSQFDTAPVNGSIGSFGSAA